MSGRPLHVLVIDDSAVVRQAVDRRLRRQEGWTVSLASDGVMALERIRAQRPDVILLDLEMPRLDGLTFLRHLMATHPIPVVVCSAHAEAGSSSERTVLQAGAHSVVAKPRLAVKSFLEGPDAELEEVLRRAAAQGAASTGLARVVAGAAAGAEVIAARREVASEGDAAAARALRTVLLGASMGGPSALHRILSHFPADGPPFLVVQHMQGSFTSDFVRRLDAAVEMEVTVAQGGDVLRPGRVLVAPGDHHLVVERSAAGETVVDVVGGPPVQGHRPSVDVLFRSAASILGPAAVAVLLTGMGRDGAEGLLALRTAGATTFAQAREGCTAFGMPGTALELGAAQKVVPLDVMPGVLLAASGHTGRTGQRRSSQQRLDSA